jgi:hypothetical protein
MAIKGLIPQLAERGKVKIGEKGEMKTSQGGKQFSQPRKLDHFVITTMQRDQAGRLMPDAELTKRYLEKQGATKLTEIPILLLYDDIDLNFLTRYSCYVGNRCWCSGDGEEASQLTGENGKYAAVSCPCERQDPLYQGKEKCKTLGTLQVLLQGVDRVGGVWKFRTTSWNTVNAILSSLALIKTITGGPLSGIPLYMVLSPKTVTIPTTGQSMVVYVVSLEYRGPEEQLAQIGYEIAKRRIDHQIRMGTVETQARRLLVAPHEETIQDQQETAEEFYPEGVVVETASLEPRSNTKGDDPLLPPSPGLDATGAEDAFPAEQVYVIPQETKRPEPQEEVPPGWDSIPHGGPSTAAPPKQRGGSIKGEGRALF